MYPPRLGTVRVQLTSITVDTMLKSFTCLSPWTMCLYFSFLVFADIFCFFYLLVVRFKVKFPFLLYFVLTHFVLVCIHSHLREKFTFENLNYFG